MAWIQKINKKRLAGIPKSAAELRGTKIEARVIWLNAGFNSVKWVKFSIVKIL